MLLSCSSVITDRIGLRERGSATSRTSCASCEMIVLLWHCVQHLLISIMGYAPMHRETLASFDFTACAHASAGSEKTQT